MFDCLLVFKNITAAFLYVSEKGDCICCQIGQIDKLLVDPYHYGSCFHDGIGLFAHLQLQFLDGVHGNGGGDDIAASDIDLNDAVDRSFGDADNSSLELVACAALMTINSYYF